MRHKFVVTGLIMLAVLAASFLNAQSLKVATLCDELASHPSDPDRVAQGVSSSAVDHAAAIAACLLAVEQEPLSPRLNYLLGRVYFYDGQAELAIPHLNRAADSDYRQAQFVLGYVLVNGLQGVPKDACRAERLWARSAKIGRLAALVSYPHHVLRGHFGRCEISQDDAQMVQFLQQAKDRDLDYYQNLLVDDLLAEMQGLRVAP